MGKKKSNFRPLGEGSIKRLPLTSTSKKICVIFTPGQCCNVHKPRHGHLFRTKIEAVMNRSLNTTNGKKCPHFLRGIVIIIGVKVDFHFGSILVAGCYVFAFCRNNNLFIDKCDVQCHICCHSSHLRSQSLTLTPLYSQ